MKKIGIIIGTRPQYIKIKPLVDMLKNKKIKHFIIDTSQHYSENVSSEIVKDLKLKIDYQIKNPMGSEIVFMSEISKEMETILKKEKPNVVVVIGDTNSTFCGSLVSYKMKIPLAHIESGLRCNDFRVPEEINRIFSDSVATWKFCSSYQAVGNLKDKEGIYTGDLEYELLKNMDLKITSEDFGVMTIHRQSNCNIKRIEEIMNFCKEIKKEVIFPVHHRTKEVISCVKIPKNVSLIAPVNFTKMIDLLSRTRFVITDSGGLQKTSGFFGKPTVVVRKKTEWIETEEVGIVKKFDDFGSKDLKNWILKSEIKRFENLYMKEGSPSSIIINTIFDQNDNERTEK